MGDAAFLLLLRCIRESLRRALGGNLHGSIGQYRTCWHHVANDSSGEAICVAVCPKRCAQRTMERPKVHPRMPLHHLGVGVPYVHGGRVVCLSAKFLGQLAGVGILRRESLHHSDGPHVHYAL